jgi:hypothetical protein
MSRSFRRVVYLFAHQAVISFRLRTKRQTSSDRGALLESESPRHPFASRSDSSLKILLATTIHSEIAALTVLELSGAGISTLRPGWTRLDGKHGRGNRPGLRNSSRAVPILSNLLHQFSRPVEITLRVNGRHRWISVAQDNAGGFNVAKLLSYPRSRTVPQSSW